MLLKMENYIFYCEKPTDGKKAQFIQQQQLDVLFLSRVAMGWTGFKSSYLVRDAGMVHSFFPFTSAESKQSFQFLAQTKPKMKFFSVRG